MPRAGKLVALSAALAAAGCGRLGPDFYVRGTGVVVQSDAAFTRSPDFPPRIESTLDAALRYWGGSWEALAGRTITFEGDRYVHCGQLSSANGCYDGNIRVSTRDAGFVFSCVEQTVLVHEVGHAVIGDAGHLDPRWMDFGTLELELAGRLGYGEGGEVACQIFVSVWRHPPRA